MNFDGKIVWITGASGGIGKALAVGLAKKGAHLILSARNESLLNSLNKELGGNHRVIPLDMTDYDAVQKAVDSLIAEGAVPDVLVNNAGISQRSLTIETDMDVYRRLMELDYFAVVYITKALLPAMLEKKGMVVTVSSVAGKMATRLRSGYSGAKFAVYGFMDALRAESHAQGLKVVVVAPGMIATDVAKNALVGDGNHQGYDDTGTAAGIDVNVCASRIIKGLEAGKDEIVVAGAREQAALLLNRFWPSQLRKFMRTAKVN